MSSAQPPRLRGIAQSVRHLGQYPIRRHQRALERIGGLEGTGVRRITRVEQDEKIEAVHKNTRHRLGFPHNDRDGWPGPE